ncbi:hypothetical protein LI328DRAFT_162986 [Trichoderma asperelloides]|nr:hypothetical protein LI328DRAFT_162986 [Trichoderma asperelloides]
MVLPPAIPSFPCHNECNRKGWIFCLASLFAATYATVSLSSSNESDALPGSFAEEQMTLCFYLSYPTEFRGYAGYLCLRALCTINSAAVNARQEAVPTCQHGKCLHGGRVVEKPPLSARPDWSRSWRWRCETWAFSLQADKGRYIVKSALTTLSRSAIGGECRKCYPLHSFYLLFIAHIRTPQIAVVANRAAFTIVLNGGRETLGSAMRHTAA